MTLLASALTDWVGAVAAALTAGFAVFGVAQLLDIKRQTKQSALANVSQSYAQVSERMWALRQLLLEHADWVPYFYYDLELGPHVPDEMSTQLELICEEIVDFADALIEQRNTIPGADMDW